MPDKDFNRVLDIYLETGKMESHEYEAMDDIQRYIFQQIKKAIKRLKAKNARTRIQN